MLLDFFKAFTFARMKDMWQKKKNEVEIVQIILTNSQFKEVLSTVSPFKCHVTK